jgi:hypothetical protein
LLWDQQAPLLTDARDAVGEEGGVELGVRTEDSDPAVVVHVRLVALLVHRHDYSVAPARRDGARGEDVVERLGQLHEERGELRVHEAIEVDVLREQAAEGLEQLGHDAVLASRLVVHKGVDGPEHLLVGEGLVAARVGVEGLEGDEARVDLFIVLRLSSLVQR